jgi:glycosyltransferase involved in cell wall biosynthesis
MRFSIITVTLNAEKFLSETLHSVAQQQGVSWDGGSGDGTLEIVRSFPGITLIEGKDGGIADAMNRAVAHAKGEFLIHLHADDLLAHPHVLLMVERTLQQRPHLEWLYGRAHLIDERGSCMCTTPYEPYSARRLRKYNYLTHPAVILSTALFKKIGGFQTHLRYCMDYDLWLRLSQITSPHALATPLACFRQHPGSLSTHESLHVTDEAYRVRNHYVAHLYERFRSYRTWKKRRNP